MNKTRQTTSEAILDYIAGSEGGTTPFIALPDLAVILDRSTSSVTKAIQELKARGSVAVVSRRLGPGGGSTYQAVV